MMFESSGATATNRLREPEVTIWGNTLGVSVASEDTLAADWVNSGKIAYLGIGLEFQRGHRGVEINSLEVPKEQNLTVSLTTIAKLRVFIFP